MAFMEEFHHLNIQLEDIKSATNNFGDDNIIGIGGFGKVYKGSIFHSKRQIMVAFKRLDRRYGQGDPEFLKEIMMLSRYKHDHLISLLGFCNEDGEKILVYELASHGSLDCHLSAPSLTWSQRLRICIGAARGISYLHDPNGTQQRVLHRDIKSSNILLDENWNAKVSDFGLSKIGPANQQYSFLFSNVVGTPGYLDPHYFEMYFLTKESDVYSFGVVLFEVLCGRLCFEYDDGRFHSLVPIWKQSYEQKKLDRVIFQDMNQQMDPSSLKRYSDIAYQCLQKTYKQRPTMSRVVEELELAIEIQNTYDERMEYEEMIALEIQESKDYKDIIKTAVPPLIYGSQEELKMLISKGVLLNMGKTWFSLNKNGENCEMISAAECLIPIESVYNNDPYSSEYNSRFRMGSYLTFNRKFTTRVQTQFLTPKTVYTVNVVFKFIKKNWSCKWQHVAPKYRLEGNTKFSIVYLVDEREDGWLSAALFELTSESRNVELEIIFETSNYYYSSLLAVEGIEFQPMEKVEHEVLEDEKVDIEPVLNSDTYWEQKLPNDNEEILKWSKDSVQWTTKKELYFLLCKGFPINNGLEWFYLAKDGKKCLMLPARTTLETDRLLWCSLTESRFGEAAVIFDWRFSIVGNINSQLLSPQTTYATYLVYKLKKYHSISEAPVIIMDKRLSPKGQEVDDFWFIYLLSPQTPIIRGKDVQNTNNQSKRPKTKGLPQQRNDGWMEVQIWELQTTSTATEMLSMRLELTLSDNRRPDNRRPVGLYVQGIEFKPVSTLL